MIERFEAAWAGRHGLGAVATASWTGGALAALAHARRRGRNGDRAVQHVHGHPARGPRRRRPPRLRRLPPRRPVPVLRGGRAPRSTATTPRAVVLVHIGGHIAFDVERIAALCRDRGVALIEDCAHAHGATWNGRRAGSWGDAGVYSLYATKTISTGEGGVLVSRDPELLAFARAFRNYGKPDHDVTRPELPHVRVHRRARRWCRSSALGRDRRLEERGGARAARPGRTRPPGAAGRHGLGPLQVHRLRPDRALDRPGLRRAVPPHHGHRRRPAEHRLGRRAPLVRPALLPARRQDA